jgi:putative methyltransferase (TIGR04325 family)
MNSSNQSALRRWVRDWFPPPLRRWARSFSSRSLRLQGVFPSWQDALRHTSGYDSELILEKVREAALKVKAGEASFERDSVLFACPQCNFPVVAGLLRAAVESRGRLSVLDFGGSLGSSYFQCRPFLGKLAQLRWSVVEQPRFVACGKELFQSEELRFYDSIADCLQREAPQVILFSSVLQYLEAPFAVLQQVRPETFPYVVVDRTFFTSGSADVLTVQLVPRDIYPASYPAWIFSLQKFRRALSPPYEVLAEFDSPEGTVGNGRLRADCKGLVFFSASGSVAHPSAS